jgi:hypothetical protein
MRRRLRIPALLAALLAAGLTPSVAGSKWEWNDVERVVAIGDIHGTHDLVTQLVRGSGLTDDELRWTGGKSHLVVVGDFVDRNSDDRAVIDLLRRLEKESAEAGGRVHALLGNHEVMNLVRDLRYVETGSFEDFADQEREKDRRVAKKSFVNRRPRTKSVEELEAEFERRCPPGYFGRLRAFDPDGFYGKWLLGLPVIVKINDVVYVHGGLTESVAALGLEGINKRVRRELLYHFEQRRVLERGGIVSRWMNLSEMQDAAVAVQKRRVSGGVTDELRNASGSLLKLANQPIFGPKGPLWYRGLSLEDERIERTRLTAALELLGAKRMVVAHSPTPNSSITARFGGRLYRVDHGIYKSKNALALVFEDGDAFVLDPVTGARVKPTYDHPTGESSMTYKLVPDESLEQFLRGARVVDSRDLGRGSTRPMLFELEDDGTERRAVFKRTPAGPRDKVERERGVWDRHEHEVAAYRLDRKLGLGMVPVTVLRKHDDRIGSLQVFVEGAVDQESVQEYDLELIPPERDALLMARARFFDVLIGNYYRAPSDILYVEDEARIMLIDHSRAFSTSPELDDDAPLPTTLEPALLDALTALSESWTGKSLEGLLSPAQVEALLVRRDRILARYESTGTD